MCKHMSVTIVDSHPSLGKDKHMVICLDCGKANVKLTDFS